MSAPASAASSSTESLEVRVISAINISPDKSQDFDAYVKVEMRGQDGLVKARTAAGKWLGDGNIKFDETLRLPIPVGAEEIRLKVCKDKKRVFLSGSNVMSNAGIYLRDLLRFVPIEKEFGLFRPTDKTPGGTIKMFFDYKPNTPIEAASEAATDQAPAPVPTTPQEVPAPASTPTTAVAKAPSPAPAPADAAVMTPAPVTPAPVTPAPVVPIKIAATATAAPVKAAPSPPAQKKKGGFPLIGMLIVVAGAGFGIHVQQQKKTKVQQQKKTNVQQQKKTKVGSKK